MILVMNGEVNYEKTNMHIKESLLTMQKGNIKDYSHTIVTINHVNV